MIQYIEDFVKNGKLKVVINIGSNVPRLPTTNATLTYGFEDLVIFDDTPR